MSPRGSDPMRGRRSASSEPTFALAMACSAIALGVVVAGCGFPSFAFDPADSGADDAAPIDAAAEGGLDAADGSTVRDAPDADGLVADTTADTTATDTGVTLDTADSAVGGDTADPDTSPVGRACVAGAAHAFCEDFDEGSPPPKLGFDVLGAATGDATGLETSFSASPPRSFFALVKAGSSVPGGAFGSRLLTAPTVSSTTRIDVDLYLESASYSIETVVFRVQRASNYHGVGVALDPTGFILKVDGASAAVFPLPTPPLHRWFHVRLDATLLLTGGAFALYIDDLTTPVLAKDKLSTTDVEEVGREAFFGPYVVSAVTDDLRLRFDDIVVDFF